MNLQKKFSKSSSFHIFNADRNVNQPKLSILQKIVWLILNFINNNLPPKLFKNHFGSFNLTVKSFADYIEEKEWNMIAKEITPSRMLCDLFWIKLDWHKIKSEIGSINIFDTGCGNGNYASKLNQYAFGINSYTGIDSAYYENWENLKNISYINLINYSSIDFINIIPKGTNVFITQSAIEHFDFDIEYFKQISNFIKSSNDNIIQIHLFPSTPSLWLYLYHGVRQYNMRSIQKIIELFNDSKTYSVIYPLGGINSYNYHLRKITIPQYIFKSKKKYSESEKNKYFYGAKSSIIKDINKHTWENASFCALVMHSNYKNKIF